MATTNDISRITNYIEETGVSAPGTPGSGKNRLYCKTDGKIYLKNDAGTEYNLTDKGTAFTLAFTNSGLATGVLTMTHNLGYQYPEIVIFDNNGLEVLPDSITATSTTAAAVSIISQGTISGTWHAVANLGGGISGAFGRSGSIISVPRNLGPRMNTTTSSSYTQISATVMNKTDWTVAGATLAITFQAVGNMSATSTTAYFSLYDYTNSSEIQEITTTSTSTVIITGSALTAANFPTGDCIIGVRIKNNAGSTGHTTYCDGAILNFKYTIT